MADPPGFTAPLDVFASGAESAAWITPRGEVRRVADHKEIYEWDPTLGSWNDAYERGWVRVGKQFGLAFVDGSPAAIDRHRDAVLSHMDFNEVIVQYEVSRFDRREFAVTREEFADMSSADLLRRQRLLRIGMARRPVRGYRRFG